jgi:hypothetical protein
VSSKHGFRFSHEEIEQQINALYVLDDLMMDAIAGDEDQSVHDEKAHQLRFYFNCLADSLWEAGVFKSQQEARSFIRADVDVLQNAGGPGGLCPDDGLLNPGEIAEGLIALRNLNKFLFQAPICFLSSKLNIEFTADDGDINIRLTRNYNDLSLVKMHPKLRADEESQNYLWIEGSIKEHRYDVVRPAIDRLVVSAMGIMEVIGLARYSRWSPALRQPAQHVSIGTKDRINSGAYIDMVSVRLFPHLIGLYDPPAENEIDGARTSQSRLESNLHILTRAISDRGPSGLAVHHACRMYLRAYETWNAGESATFFAITMEGLLLDKRQKDDLSARLQDSVAYWLGGSATDRERTRRCIADLYKVRSNYVHNGEDAPSGFDVDGVRELTRKVIRKELLTLGPKKRSGPTL